MNFNRKQIKDIIWILPGIVALLIALIPTLNLQWSLTVDIFYHIHIAQVYSQYGITLTDPLIDPGMGRKIGYPPLFSLVLAFLVKALNIDYFQVAKLLQPILAFSVVLSVSYVAKEFYGNIAGISAGFLLISSHLFSRLVSPLPETMALIFVPLAVYFYYKSVRDKQYSYALVSGIFFILVILTHQATALTLFLVITAVVIVLGILCRNIRYFISYGIFLLLPVAAGESALIALSLISPGFMQNVITNGLTTVTGYTTSLLINEPISYAKYIVYIGIVFLFAIIGCFSALRKRRVQDLILIIWIIMIFLLSKAYWFGVNVYSIRLLIHLLIPISIVGGLGLAFLYTEFKKKEFTSKKVRSGFLITTLVIASLFAVTTVEDPNFGLIPKYSFSPSNDSLKAPQIAPPTYSDMDLANWFIKNGDKKSVLISNNYYTNQFLLATTEQPIASGASLEQCIGWEFGKLELKNKNICYFIFDKRLTLPSDSNSQIIIWGGMIFLNNNLKDIIQRNMVLVYENKDYYVFKNKLLT